MRRNIFRILEKNYIQKLFETKKGLFFPLIRGRISNIEIEKTSPNWARETCLVRYKILFDDKSQKIIRGTAKANKPKQSAWKIMKYLYSKGFNSGHLQIAKPLDYISNINLLLYEEAPGTTLTEIIKKNNKTIIENTLKNTAKWLVKLHKLDLKHKKIPTAVFLGSPDYKKTFQKIERFMPELKNNLIPLNKIKFVDQLWCSNKTLIHNDFYPGNSITDKKNIFCIDFDRTGTGPFLMDIASFYGALDFPRMIWNLKLTKKQRCHFQNIFLLEYCRLRKLDYFQTKKDLRKFLAKIFLDQIHYYTTFTIKGWSYMDKKTKGTFILKIKVLLQKTKQYLKNL